MPMTMLSRGGRYCSIMTVERGKALVLERRTAKTATPVKDERLCSCITRKHRCYSPSIPESLRVVRSADSQSLLPMNERDRHAPESMINIPVFRLDQCNESF
jgi:hypothetical protein